MHIPIKIAQKNISNTPYPDEPAKTIDIPPAKNEVNNRITVRIWVNQ